jgi:uncharacterized membrane protein HdeD (DUF308 family)
MVYRHTTSSSVLLGILAIIVGLMALVWPGVTVLALVLLFALYAFAAAGMQAMHAFSSRTAGPVIGHLVLALLDFAAGLFVVAWPGPTALVLLLIVGIWAVVGGTFEFLAAFRAGEPASLRTLLTLGGLVSVAFGVVILARPGIGALTLALLFGLFAFTYGIWQLTIAVELRGRSE